MRFLRCQEVRDTFYFVHRGEDAMRHALGVDVAAGDGRCRQLGSEHFGKTARGRRRRGAWVASIESIGRVISMDGIGMSNGLGQCGPREAMTSRTLRTHRYLERHRVQTHDRCRATGRVPADLAPPHLLRQPADGWQPACGS